MKLKWKIFGGILILGIVAVIYFPIQYYFSIQNANTDFESYLCETQKAESFIGIITDINRFDFNEYMSKQQFGIEITIVKPKDTLIEHIFENSKYAELFTDIRIGDTIKKIAGKNKFTLGTSGTEHLMPNCKK